MLATATTLILALVAGAFGEESFAVPTEDVVALRVAQETGYALTRDGTLVTFALYRRTPDAAPLLVETYAVGVGVDLAIVGTHVCVLSPTRDVACFSLPALRRECHTASDFDACAGSMVAAPLVHLDAGAMALSGNRSEVCALDAVGAVTCWPPGEVARTHVVATVPDATMLDYAGNQACVRRASGRVSCWRDEARVSSDGGHAGVRSGVEPPAVPQVTDTIAVAVAPEYACALRKNGDVLCWGERIPDGARLGHRGPRGPTRLPSADVVQMSAATDSVCVATRGGSVECYLGLSRREPESAGPTEPAAPLRLPMTSARAVAHASRALICALDEDRRVRCLGSVGGARRSYNDVFGTFSVRTTVGGGKRIAPSAAAEALLDTGLRADVLLGRPVLRRVGFRAGPLVDLRRADWHTWEAAAAVSTAFSHSFEETNTTPGWFDLSLSAGAGRASRSGAASGTFAFASLGIGIHTLLHEPAQPGGGLCYAPGAALYVTARRDLDQGGITEITAGLDTDPIFALVALVVVFEELFR